MDYRGREADFQEAEHRFAEVKRQFDAGALSAEEFDAQRRQLMVQDDEGRWWAKSKTGQWNYHDGNAWISGTPPGYQAPRTPPVEDMPDRQSQQPEQDERLLSSQTALFREKRRRRIPRWVVIALGLGVIVALVGTLAGIETFTKGSLTKANPAPGYDLLEHPSGKLSVEVPTAWKEHVTTNPEGEKGTGWDSFAGESVIAMTAANDLHSWSTGSKGHQGTYIAASKKLAQSYTDDQLVALGPNNYSSSCQTGPRKDFDRAPYSGKIQEWYDCGGITGHTATTLAAAPKDRGCVVLLLIGGYLEGEEENVQHVLDTFDADCKGIS
ncbi:MAG: SHOCT domain-containing protein [Rubrobacter sp.]|nr:SHOCT domain-containing protein [Rubrobacter sp.]